MPIPARDPVDLLQHAPCRVEDPDSGGATGGQMWTTGTYDPALNLVFRRNRKSDAGSQWRAAPGDNTVDLQHRRAESGHREACLGISSLST